jgi:hypothetical protein
MPGIVIQSLAFSLQERTLVVRRIDREDLPHLTVSWNNPSGEIDVHLTPLHPKDDSDRESIAKIPETELSAYLQSLSKRFLRVARTSLLQIIWSVGASWLARNNYFLIGTTGESIEHWLRRVVPKQRGKYRFDVGVFKKNPEMILHHPSARRFSELGAQGQIFAICRKGQEKGRLLILMPLSWPEGPLTWVAYDYRDVRRLVKAAKELLNRDVGKLAPTQMNRIQQVLRLKEVGW